VEKGAQFWQEDFTPAMYMEVGDAMEGYEDSKMEWIKEEDYILDKIAYEDDALSAVDGRHYWKIIVAREQGDSIYEQWYYWKRRAIRQWQQAIYLVASVPTAKEFMFCDFLKGQEEKHICVFSFLFFLFVIVVILFSFSCSFASLKGLLDLFIFFFKLNCFLDSNVLCFKTDCFPLAILPFGLVEFIEMWLSLYRKPEKRFWGKPENRHYPDLGHTKNCFVNDEFFIKGPLTYFFNLISPNGILPLHLVKHFLIFNKEDYFYYYNLWSPLHSLAAIVLMTAGMYMHASPAYSAMYYEMSPYWGEYDRPGLFTPFDFFWAPTAFIFQCLNMFIFRRNYWKLFLTNPLFIGQHYLAMMFIGFSGRGAVPWDRDWIWFNYLLFPLQWWWLLCEFLYGYCTAGYPHTPLIDKNYYVWMVKLSRLRFPFIDQEWFKPLLVLGELISKLTIDLPEFLFYSFFGEMGPGPMAKAHASRMGPYRLKVPRQNDWD
jgi:hypothetical protein